MMAINRLVLSMAVALVVIIAPATGGVLRKLFSCYADHEQCNHRLDYDYAHDEIEINDHELLAKLGRNSLLPKYVKPYLKSIKDKAGVTIAGYTVEELLYLEEIRLPILDDCRYVSFSESHAGTYESYSTLLLNVFNFVNAHDEKLKESCAENIRKNLDMIQEDTKNNDYALVMVKSHITNDELLVRLGEKELPAREVKIILFAIRDKIHVHIGVLEVKTLLLKEQIDGLIDDCRYQAGFEGNLERLRDSDLTLVLNVFNFVNDRNEVYKKSCAEEVKESFKKAKLVAELAGNIPTDEFGEKLELIENKESFKLGRLTVQVILLKARKQPPTLEDCEYSSISIFLYMTGGRNLIANIRNFINYQQLLSFCSKNFKQMYERAVTVRDKRLIKEYGQMKDRITPDEREKDAELKRFRDIEGIDNRCSRIKEYLRYIEILIENCNSDSCKSDLEPIIEELKPLENDCIVYRASGQDVIEHAPPARIENRPYSEHFK